MNIGEICTREVVCTTAATSVAAAAKLMRQYRISDVIVTRNEAGKRVPLGIVTERDIVLSIVAAERVPESITVGDIMSRKLATAAEDEDVFDTIQRMREMGIRRMPIVDGEGALCGIVSLDGIIEVLAEEMNELVRLIARLQFEEQRA